MVSRGFGYLASSEELRVRVTYQEGAVVGLVNYLSEHDNPQFQGNAAKALAELASSEELRIRIANQEWALVGIACQSLTRLFHKNQQHQH